MSYEIFEQGPDVFMPILLLSLAVTIVMYSVFPLVFAYTRKVTITKKKYKLLCYGINFAIAFMFTLINVIDAPLNGGPYILWTTVFSNLGAKILCERRVIIDDEALRMKDEPVVGDNNISFCRKCGSKLLDNSRFCSKCGTEIAIVYSNTTIEYQDMEFCKKCGADITNDTDICHVCGEQKGTD